MLAAAVLLVAGALSAPGEIYRCIGPDGRARFTDEPCAGKPPAHGAVKADSDPRELRKWLEQMHKEAGRAVQPAVPADAARRPAAPSARSAVAQAGPADERLLALCSQRFLDCANGNAVAMDACIAKSPRCAAGSRGSCCPEACIGRYQGLRRAGAPMASAVRNALLDPQAPSCTVAQ